MTGLLLIFVFGVWFVIAKWIASKIIDDIRSPKIKKVVKPLILPLLMFAPLADEVIGGVQFYPLCTKSAVLSVDEDKLRNKIVLSQGAPSTYLPGYFLPIRQQHWSYANPDTGEIVISWNAYHAKGGLFIRSLGISQTSAPLTFNGVCYPDGTWPKIFKNLNITVKDKK